MNLHFLAVATLMLFLLSPATWASRQDEPAPTKASVTYDAIRAGYDSAMKQFDEEAEKVKTGEEFKALSGKLYSDTLDFSRRLVDLAATEPTDPASREALVWVLTRYAASPLKNRAPFDAMFGQAVDLVVGRHCDDLGVSRTVLGLSPRQSGDLDRLFAGLLERSTARDVKGTACLAMARHLETKARLVRRLRREPSPFRIPVEATDEAGKTSTKLGDPLFEPSYEAELRALDPDALDREAYRLFDRVIAQYADVPYAEGAGGPGTERSLARKRTLGQEAERLLDEKRNLAVGKPAPEIVAACLDGKTRKLSDYRGKVVVLVFWGSWCGPCMQQVPHERSLAERHKDRPFTLLGVDAEVSMDDGLRTALHEKMSWPHWFDGVPGEGPIVDRYRVRKFPSVFVIDAKGVIRFKDVPGAQLDTAVEDLLKEAEPQER